MSVAVERRHLAGQHDQKTHAGGRGGDAGSYRVRSGQPAATVLSWSGYEPVLNGRGIRSIAGSPDELAALTKHTGAIEIARNMTRDERAAVELELSRPIEDDYHPIRYEAEHARMTVENTIGIVEGLDESLGVSFQMKSVSEYLQTVNDFDTADAVSGALDAHTERLRTGREANQERYGTDPVGYARADADLVRSSLTEFSDDVRTMTGVGVAEGWAAAVNKGWSQSSQSTLAAAVQLEVAARRGEPMIADGARVGFGTVDVPESMGWLASHAIDAAAATREDYPASVSAYVSAQLRHTSAVLDAAGIDPSTRISLFRGIKSDAALDTSTGEFLARTNPLSSWTTRREVAEDFAGGAFADGYILSTSVPVSDVFSTATLSGHGSIRESEVIVMGGTLRAVDAAQANEGRSQHGGEPVNLDEIGDADWIKHIDHDHDHDHDDDEEAPMLNVRVNEPAAADEADDRSAVDDTGEYRTVDFVLDDVTERRSKDGTRLLTFEGVAAVFNRPTPIVDYRGRFIETFNPHAFDRTLAHARRGRNRYGIKFLFDHGHHPLIGAFPIGALRLAEPRSHGLFVRADVPQNWLVQPVIDGIRSGAIPGMSINFIAVNEKWGDSSEGRTRELLEVNLTELGPVLEPAYSGTEASIRSLAAQRDVLRQHSPELFQMSGTADEAPADEDRSGPPPMTTLEALDRVLRHRTV